MLRLPNRSMELIVFSLLILLLSSCGVGYLPKMTEKKLASYESVFALSKDRYANLYASLGLSGWKLKEEENYQFAYFEIATNTVRQKESLSTFLDDMRAYCGYRGGIFNDMKSRNKAGKNEIIKKHTKKIWTVKTFKPCFECGPKGKGTVSCDWTKFNPLVCRELPERKQTTVRKVTDWKKVKKEYGQPPLFNCRLKNGYLFVGYVNSKSNGNVVQFDVVLKKKKNSLLSDKEVNKIR